MKLFLCFFLLLNARAVAGSDSTLTYTGVIKAESVTAEQIYIRARSWFNESFNSSKDVLQIQDKEAKELSGKAIFYITVPFKGAGGREYQNKIRINFNVSVWAKDSRYKYLVDNIEATSLNVTESYIGKLTSSEDMPGRYPGVSKDKLNKYWHDIKTESEKKITEMLKGLEAKVSENKGDNW